MTERGRTVTARLCAVLLGCIFFLSSTGEVFAATDAAVPATRIYDIYMARGGPMGIDGFADGPLCETAGDGAEFTVLALCQCGISFDASAYLKALHTALTERERNAVEQQRVSLALCALGETDDPFLTDLVDRTFGKMGVMSMIFGLHCLNNACPSEVLTALSAAHMLCERQNGDGGFSLSGDGSDSDVSAMALQALAPHRGDAEVDACIERVLVFLEHAQCAYGGYSSYGAENAESAAQVIIALASLGIDPKTDERFIKNSRSLYDVLADFACENGYAHVAGGDAQDGTTRQVFLAAVAALRAENGLSPLFVLEPPSRPLLSAGEVSDITPDTDSPTRAGQADYRVTATWICIALAAVLFCIAVVCRLKKRRALPFTVAGVACLAAIAFIWLTHFESAEQFYSGSRGGEDGTVTLSISCAPILDRDTDGKLPQDGWILEPETYTFSDGDTVYTVLSDAVRRHRLQWETSGSGALVYIRAIDGLYEGDYGELSGWIFSVNGSMPSYGCGTLTVSDNDRIEWIFSPSLTLPPS